MAIPDAWIPELIKSGSSSMVPHVIISGSSPMVEMLGEGVEETKPYPLTFGESVAFVSRSNSPKAKKGVINNLLRNPTSQRHRQN